MTAKILVVVAHPVIASGIETLLKLEGDYEIKRVVSVADAMNSAAWGAQVALVDGTLLDGQARVRIGAPTIVLSGSESMGRELSRKVIDGRGWLRKDATGAELAKAIRAAVERETSPQRGIGTVAIFAIAIASAIALVLVAYLVWLALY